MEPPQPPQPYQDEQSRVFLKSTSSHRLRAHPPAVNSVSIPTPTSMHRFPRTRAFCIVLALKDSSLWPMVRASTNVASERALVWALMEGHSVSTNHGALPNPGPSSGVGLSFGSSPDCVQRLEAKLPLAKYFIICLVFLSAKPRIKGRNLQSI